MTPVLIADEPYVAFARVASLFDTARRPPRASIQAR